MTCHVGPAWLSHWRTRSLDGCSREVMTPLTKSNLSYQVWNISHLDIRGTWTIYQISFEWEQLYGVGPADHLLVCRNGGTELLQDFPPLNVVTLKMFFDGFINFY